MIYSIDFEICWKEYPLKKGKFQAYKTWQKIKADLPGNPEILKALHNQKKERVFLKQQNRFVPPWKHFSTWLNARSWTDECELGLQVARIRNIQPSNGLENMQRALNILTNLGEVKFKEFCKATKMPPGDVEAVEFKFQGAFNVKSLTRRIGG